MPPRVLLCPPRAGGSLGRLAAHIASACAPVAQAEVLPYPSLIVEKSSVPLAGQVNLLVLTAWQTALMLREYVTRIQGCAPRLLLALYEGWSPRRSRLAAEQFVNACWSASFIVAANPLIRSIIPEECPCAVLPDAVDTDLFTPAPLPQEFRAGWVGNSQHCLGEVKGLDLVRAACAIAHIPLDVLDTSTLKEELQHERMPRWYSHVSCYVCGSHEHEGGPVPPLEAAACARPVVSTKTPTMEQFIEPAMGRLVDRSPEAIATALVELRDKPRESLEEMGAAARQRALEWSWHVRSMQWCNAVLAALSGPEVAHRVGPTAIYMPGMPPSLAKAADDADTADAKRAAEAVVPTREQTLTSMAKARERVWMPASPPERDKRPLIALIADVHGWAFDVNELAMADYVPEVKFAHLFVVDQGTWPELQAFDRCFFPYQWWKLMQFEDPETKRYVMERALGSLRGAYFKPDAKDHTPDKDDIALVNSYGAGFHVVTQQAFDWLKRACPRVVYLTNPVDTRHFDEPTPVRGEVIASWTGNAKHKTPAGIEVKGLGIVQRAAMDADVPLVMAEYSSCRLPPSAMPEFFCRANVTLCASLYEGASNSVMESMACGHAIIATDVGNHGEMKRSELEHFGESGILLVKRDAGSFAAALAALKRDPARVQAMGEINRAEIRKRWSWDAWAPRYRAFFLRGLVHAST